MREPPWWSDAVEYSKQHIKHCNCGVMANGEPIGFVRIDVPVGHRLFGKAIPCVCKLDNMAKANARRLRALSNMDNEDFTRFRFDTFDVRLSVCPTWMERKAFLRKMSDILDRCRQYASAPAPNMLILSGGYGAGKTHLAKAIANGYLARGGEVYFSTVPDLLDMLRAGYRNSDGDPGEPGYEDRATWLRGIGMLVLDDFGAQRGTDWATEKLYQLLNARYERHAPTVITTNLDLRDKSVGVDPRLSSRLADSRNEFLFMPCGDFRRRE